MVNIHSVQLTLVNTPLVEKMHQTLQGQSEINAQVAFNATIETLYEKRHQVNESNESRGAGATDEDGGKETREEAHKRQEQERKQKEEEAVRDAFYAERDQGKIINIKV